MSIWSPESATLEEVLEADLILHVRNYAKEKTHAVETRKEQEGGVGKHIRVPQRQDVLRDGEEVRQGEGRQASGGGRHEQEEKIKMTPWERGFELGVLLGAVLTSLAWAIIRLAGWL